MSDIASKKAAIIADIKRHAHDMLKDSDWYSLRAAEGGKNIPFAVLTRRDAIRKASDRAVAAIERCGTIDEVGLVPWPSFFE